MDLSPSESIDNKPQQINPNNTSSEPGTGTLTVDQLDIELLPVIYDIIRCVEKDPLDNAAKQRESQECSQKILELQKRFESARNQIKQLPGIDYNKEEQLQKLELLKSQLKLKQQLIKKYKNIQF
ncbi:mediator of RNA polymerase II transcription subunit 9 [Episyrphus balteatus]|uniref:mediator of RNA polymerase II transcription subunit 9 n=1 Tax=Episyrphus balteatus TaxID=286459 RepID=UPI0024859F8A|nr:mediator of RNA polymerase II transcription subunit 9 [Episyrphus balteatus]